MKFHLSLMVLFVSQVNSARILGVFQIPSISHQCVFQPIWKELSLRGHEVIVVTPNPLKDPTLVNLTEIDTSDSYKTIQKHGFQFFMNKDLPVYDKIPRLFNLNYDVIEQIFLNKEFRKIYENPKEKFDLILVQTYISPILYSLSAKFKAPIIGVSSMGGWSGSHYAMGNPNPPAIFSEMFLPYNGKLNFRERIYSTAYFLFTRFYENFVAIPQGDQLMRKYLGEDMPYLAESEKNLSMLFLNTNPILYPARPTVPTIIELGQMHLKPTKPLPQDLKDFLDSSKEGVIYFSLGSNVKSVNIPTKLRETIIATFAELPYKVLWKWEADDMPGRPVNVITKKWLPQQDLLSHPNIKVFITQCGLQSLEESFTHGVPIVGMPFIADQLMNIKKLEEFGVGLGVDYNTLTKDTFKKTILKVAQDKQFRDKVQEIKRIITDKPKSGLENAVWWAEYVIRHKGTKHLRSPLLEVSWIEYLLLDVLGAIFGIIFLTSFILWKLIKCLVNFWQDEPSKTKFKRQ